jgi:soluble lytic murein transglycosylase-like protein
MALLCTGFWLCGVARADIYKFVDERGVMHVTNIPLSATARSIGNRAMTRSAPTARSSAPLSIKAPPTRYAEIVDEMARAYRVDAELIHALIRTESNYNASAVSHKGAVGLMQLMPATARRYGVIDSRDAAQNIRGGVQYLRDLLDAFHHNLILTLAAYNAGEGAVARHGGVPPYAETTAYVAKVLDLYLRPGVN